MTAKNIIGRALIATVVVALVLALTPIVGASRAPTLSTDKEDYAPGDTVMIFGAGFAPGEITLTVTRPDSQVDTIPDVLADESGAFTATYPLNGIEGTYIVIATDSEGQPATTIFTDVDAKITSLGITSPTALTWYIKAASPGSVTVSVTYSYICSESDDKKGEVKVSIVGTTASVSEVNICAIASGSRTVDLSLPNTTANGKYDVKVECTKNCSPTPPQYTVSEVAGVDKTLPTASASRSPGPNANGWNNSDVTVSFIGTDTLSGIDSCSAPVTLSSEGTGQSASGTCTDKAGNVSALATATGINIDKTAPSLSGSRTPSANANGWNNTNVTVSFSCADTGSVQSGIDIDTVAGDVVSTEGENQEVTNTGACTDKAGNTANSATVSGINIDKTKPTATATASPGPNANGWNNSDVTVSFSGTDDRSGIDFCDAAVVLSTEGSGLSASGACTDKAGNVSALATASGINIDKTAPVVNITAPADGGYYKTATLPALAYTVTDNLDPSPSVVVSGWSTAEGEHTVTVTATDAAGNVGSASRTYTVDNTPPTITASATANGASYTPGTWTNKDVTVTFTCIDGLSGVATPPLSPQVVSTEGAGQSRSASCTDNAGNSASTEFTGINIDKTKPTITIIVPGNGATYTLNQAVASNYSCADQAGLSGVASCAGPVPSGGNIDTSSLGAKSFTVNAMDNAGNSASLAHSYTVISVTYNWSGFFRPVDNLPTLNLVKAGSAIPVKFSLSGYQGPNIFAEGYPKSVAISCNSTALVDAIEETIATAGGSSLNYDATADQYIYVWKTDKAWANCRQLIVKLNDGMEYRANFKFPK